MRSERRNLWAVANGRSTRGAGLSSQTIGTPTRTAKQQAPTNLYAVGFSKRTGYHRMRPPSLKSWWLISAARSAWGASTWFFTPAPTLPNSRPVGTRLPRADSAFPPQNSPCSTSCAKDVPNAQRLGTLLALISDFRNDMKTLLRPELEPYDIEVTAQLVRTRYFAHLDK